MTDFNTKAFEDRLHRVGKEIQSFFENLVTEEELDVFNPRTDFIQTKTGFEIIMDLPGLTKSDVKVELTDTMLSVSGERRIDETEDQVSWLRRERHYGRFSRTFPIPVQVQKSDIRAAFRDGVLSVTVTASQSASEDTSIDIE